jgi:hypothetical protein
MLSLILGVAAYIVTFALATFCYHSLKARRNAKRGSSITGQRKQKKNIHSDRLTPLFLCLALALGEAATRR